MPAIRLLGPDGRPLPQRPAPSARGIRARYDAAQHSPDSANHWANADGLSAAAANSPEVRRVLRNRARYERDNNSYLSGMAETLANDVIGTGPRLQLRTADRGVNRRVAAAFERWTVAVGLAETLRTYREARCIDGEGFLLLGTNPALPSPVQLDLWDLEADQVATPDLFAPTPGAVDGIVFDRHRNPVEYHVLKQHPGDTHYTGRAPWEYDRVPAALVLHWFKRRRPGQVRGVPEVTPAIPLYALLRRFTLATTSAAETAAIFAVLLKTNLPPDDAGSEAILPFDTQEIARNLMTALPEGYDATQIKPEHPATTYEMFERAILRQIARCLNIPLNVAAGDSSGYNYASGRLDHQVYHRAIGVERYHLETAILDRIFAAWLAEAWLADPDSVAGLVPGLPVPHAWYWDGFRHVDPAKEAAAQERRLANRTTSLARECAEEGYDWREVADEQAEERAYYAARGIPYPGDAPAPAAPAARPDDTEDDDDA